jgi:hypothetical protein
MLSCILSVYLSVSLSIRLSVCLLWPLLSHLHFAATTDRQMGGRTDRWTNGQAYRRTDRQADRQANKQTDRYVLAMFVFQPVLLPVSPPASFFYCLSVCTVCLIVYLARHLFVRRSLNESVSQVCPLACLFYYVSNRLLSVCLLSVSPSASLLAYMLYCQCAS